MEAGLINHTGLPPASPVFVKKAKAGYMRYVNFGGTWAM